MSGEEHDRLVRELEVLAEDVGRFDRAVENLTGAGETLHRKIMPFRNRLVENATVVFVILTILAFGVEVRLVLQLSDRLDENALLRKTIEMGPVMLSAVASEKARLLDVLATSGFALQQAQTSSRLCEHESVVDKLRIARSALQVPIAGRGEAQSAAAHSVLAGLAAQTERLLEIAAGDLKCFLPGHSEGDCPKVVRDRLKGRKCL